MLLGVKGVCVISHGSSSARAIVDAAGVAAECVEADVVAAHAGGGGRCRLRPTSSGGPLGPDEVLALIRERLAEILEIDEARSRARRSFADDLGADSLALIELVEALEEELGERTVGFSIDDEDLARPAAPCGDAVDYVGRPARAAAA